MKLQLEFSGFAQRLLLNQNPFALKIFEGKEEPAEGFNTICLTLDASERSLLRWEKSIEEAQKAVEKGFYLFWELDFSLLEGSLEDEVRFLSLQLNVHHFLEQIWRPFQDHSLGVALYRGSLDLPSRCKALEYLKGLAASLDDETTCFIFLDTTPITDLLEFFYLAHSEDFGHLIPLLKGPLTKLYPWAVPALGWEHGFSPLGFCSSRIETLLPSRQISQGVCLPKKGDPRLILQALTSFKEPFRLIPEHLLTQEWDGIDRLIIFPDRHPEVVWRKIRGFKAAGGEVIEFPVGAASLQLQETSQLSSLDASQ